MLLNHNVSSRVEKLFIPVEFFFRFTFMERKWTKMRVVRKFWQDCSSGATRHHWKGPLCWLDIFSRWERGLTLPKRVVFAILLQKMQYVSPMALLIIEYSSFVKDYARTPGCSWKDRLYIMSFPGGRRLHERNQETECFTFV